MERKSYAKFQFSNFYLQNRLILLFLQTKPQFVIRKQNRGESIYNELIGRNPDQIHLSGE